MNENEKIEHAYQLGLQHGRERASIDAAPASASASAGSIPAMIRKGVTRKTPGRKAAAPKPIAPIAKANASPLREKKTRAIREGSAPALVLKALEKHNQATLNGLVGSTGANPANIRQALRKLTDKGLIEQSGDVWRLTMQAQRANSPAGDWLQ